MCLLLVGVSYCDLILAKPESMPSLSSGEGPLDLEILDPSRPITKSPFPGTCVWFTKFRKAAGEWLLVRPKLVCGADGDLDLGSVPPTRLPLGESLGYVPRPAKLPLGESHCLEKFLGFSIDPTKEPWRLPVPWKADDLRRGVPGDSDLTVNISVLQIFSKCQTICRNDLTCLVMLK